MDLSVVSQFMSLTPDMMYKATKLVETASSYYPGDMQAQEEYLRENLIDATLEYALTLLENKKVRDYMNVAVYTDGRTFSAPTLAIYNVGSMPEMKQRIQAKLNKTEALDPVGHEDADIDNDGKPNDKNDKYIRRRRSAVAAAIAARRQRNEEVESVDEAMRDGPRQRKLAAKQYQTYGVTSRDRANLHNIAVRGDGPGNPGYEKKSTGGKGARYAGYGDQGAGNRARRRQGLEPYRGSRDPRNEEVQYVSEEDPCWKGYTQVGMKKKNGREVPNCVPSKGVSKAKGYNKEDIDFVADYLISEGLNEYGIDILIEEMGLDDFCDFVDEISSEEFLVEWRRGAGGTKVRGSGMSKSGKSIGSLKGGAKSSAIRGTAEHKARKAEREKEGSKSSGMAAALKSQSKIANAKKSQPATKSSPTQTKEKAKGGILGALKARAERDTALLKKTVDTARQVGARRAAEVKATYDAVRAKGKEAEKSASATRARRRATVATGRAAQAAGKTAIKAAGAAGAAAGQAVAAKKSGKSNAAAAGRAAGTFIKKMTKEERELLAHYFIEAEIAFNYDEVHEIFETLDQEHFDYFMEQAILMVEESGPSALSLIEEKLEISYNLSDFSFTDWRALLNESSSDEATSNLVKSTTSANSNREIAMKGKKKDGVIINPKADITVEEVEELDEKAPPGAKFERMVKHIKNKYKKGGLTKKERSIAYATAWKKYNEEVEHLEERRREDKGKPRGPEPSAAFKAISKAMGSGRLGVQPRGKKKVPGKKPPAAGEYGSGVKTPAQKVAAKRAAAKRAQDNMSSRFD